MLGEFASVSSIFHSTGHAEIGTWREDTILPYSGRAIIIPWMPFNYPSGSHKYCSQGSVPERV